MSEHVQLLSSHTYLIDGYDFYLPRRTGIYVLDEEELTIIETGPGISVPHIKEGLNKIGRELSELKHIIVTHVHLDHAGGCGQLMKEALNAVVHVHPRGEKHLVNPEKLIAGARLVYGEKFDKYFAPVVPVDSARTKVQTDGNVLHIGPDRILTFLDTPGHSRHHFSIVDSRTNGIFIGDTVGILYPDIRGDGEVFCLPSTSPSQFDVPAMLNSWKRLQSYTPDYLYFGHFGATSHVASAFRSSMKWLDIFLDLTKATAKAGDTSEDLSLRLKSTVLDHQPEFKENTPRKKEARQALEMDCHISALGLLEAYEKNRLS